MLRHLPLLSIDMLFKQGLESLTFLEGLLVLCLISLRSSHIYIAQINLLSNRIKINIIEDPPTRVCNVVRDVLWVLVSWLVVFKDKLVTLDLFGVNCRPRIDIIFSFHVGLFDFNSSFISPGLSQFELRLISGRPHLCIFELFQDFAEGLAVLRFDRYLWHLRFDCIDVWVDITLEVR